MGYVAAAYAVVLGGFLLYWWTLRRRMDMLIARERRLTRRGDSP